MVFYKIKGFYKFIRYDMIFHLNFLLIIESTQSINLKKELGEDIN